MLNNSEFECLDDVYLYLLKSLITTGEIVSPRGEPTREKLVVSFKIADPRRRYISIPSRRWSLVYALAELSWHLRGGTSVDDISWYAPFWKTVVPQNSQIIESAYGFKIFGRSEGQNSQWEMVKDLLIVDPGSRRAVLYFGSQDISGAIGALDYSCTLSLQFFIRGDKLHAHCVMRSNDIMLGLPYDIFLFTVLQELMATSLGVGLGCYYHSIGSLHLYDRDLESAERIVKDSPSVVEPMPEIKGFFGVEILHEIEIKSKFSGYISENQDLSHSNAFWWQASKILESANHARLHKKPYKISGGYIAPVLIDLAELRS